MITSVRLKLAVALLVLLAALAMMSRWHGSAPSGGESPAATADISVTAGADRGPGSLREALFKADAAHGSAKIVIRVKQISLDSPLPPLANPHGIVIDVAVPGAEVDGHALNGAPVFDVAAEQVSINGLAIRHCPGPAILLRAGRFKLTSSTIEGCDVGVDVADGIHDVALEHNSFAKNRVGVRFAADSRNSIVVGNTFSADTVAGVWAVRGKTESHDATSIVVRDNRFSADRIGIVAGNIAMSIDQNVLSDAREAAIHVIGAGASVLRNRISGSAAMGIVAEDATGISIANNEIDHAVAYGIIAKRSDNVLVQANQVHSSGYGIAFVLGDARHSSTAVDNTIVGVTYDGFDVVGESPILRHNQVLRAGGMPLRVENYRAPGGNSIYSRPFLEANSWDGDGAVVAAAHPATLPTPVAQR